MPAFRNRYALHIGPTLLANLNGGPVAIISHAALTCALPSVRLSGVHLPAAAGCQAVLSAEGVVS